MKKIMFKNFFFLTVPVSIILFILLEIIVRISFDYIDGYNNPMDYWSQASPYSAFTAKPGIYGKKTVNQHGFVSTPEINLEKDESKVRIVFLGGSSTAGMGFNLDDDETWPWKTVKILEKRNLEVDIDFINAALGAYTSFDSYGRLWSRIRFFNPDVIVVNHAWNEMYYFNEIADNPLLWRNETDYDQELPLVHRIKIKLLSISQVLVRIMIAIDKISDKHGEIGANKGISNSFNIKGLQILNDNFYLLKSFAENYKCKIFFCKQPSLISKNTKEIDKTRCNYELHGFNHNEHVKAFDSIYELIDKNIKKNYIIDLTSLSAITENFYDHIHPTRKGTEEIAKIVADSLVNNYFNSL
jgi:lysophospholipase L1-like esterase